MFCFARSLAALFCFTPLFAADIPHAFPPDPEQQLERTCFQTGQPWSAVGNLRSDGAIVYGIGPNLPNGSRIGAVTATEST